MKAARGILIAALAPLAAQVQIGVPQARPSTLIPLQARPPEIGTAAIAGTVVDSVTHNPIRKANVRLNGRIALTAVTGADGRFAFRQLPAGQYVIQTDAEKYPFGPFSLELGRQAAVTVAADEEKTDVALTLTPGASVRGRIVDEEGNPMPQCTVSPMRRRTSDSAPDVVGGALKPTDQKGEYRVENLPAGKYYLVARCFQNIPMPHAFVPRDALATVPMLTYPPTYYPAAAGLSTATPVSLTPGADLSGIDFQMTPATGIVLRGRVRPVISGPFSGIRLAPKSDTRNPFLQQGTGFNANTGEFQIPSVRPGSYELLAAAEAEGRSYFARVPVEVGATAPEPLEVAFQPVPSINGSVALEGEGKVDFKNLRVAMFPLEERPIGPPPEAEVQSDGSFTIHAQPGRWRLQVNGVPGYLKSATLGDQEIAPASFEIGSAPAALKIVISTKNTQVDVTVAGIPAGGLPVSAVLWSAG
ncbi:MAG TPA: carboxypeptidase regulatory-like domain-containing protein, partial [Bryobacteraceae bacterium]|nr:carboxypeptidase regulatory-like domain-containing protein [Bryobacteraceae bacterium]